MSRQSQAIAKANKRKLEKEIEASQKQRELLKQQYGSFASFREENEHNRVYQIQSGGSNAKLLEEKGKPNIVGRVGGEEFMAIIMHDESQPIESFCASLRDDVNKLEIPFQDTKININISGGVANSKSAKSWEDMVNLADERLYKSKENGRDQITFD